MIKASIFFSVLGCTLLCRSYLLYTKYTHFWPSSYSYLYVFNILWCFPSSRETSMVTSAWKLMKKPRALSQMKNELQDPILLKRVAPVARYNLTISFATNCISYSKTQLVRPSILIIVLVREKKEIIEKSIHLCLVTFLKFKLRYFRNRLNSLQKRSRHFETADPRPAVIDQDQI